MSTFIIRVSLSEQIWTTSDRYEQRTALQDCCSKITLKRIFMVFAEAEAVKLFANTYLALRVSYINKLIPMPK